MEKIQTTIDTPFITAVALLKLEGIAETGGQAAEFVLDGLVQVNGEVISEKRKKIYPNSKVIFNDQIEIEVLGK